MTTLGAIYTRISDDREGQSLGVERQLEDCTKLATGAGIDIVATFSDNDIGASTRTRKPRVDYPQMLERARAGEFSTIISYSNSRITRRPLELEELIVLYERHGVVIRTVVSGDDDLSKADGRMVARIKAAVDAAEAERTAERVARANDQKAALGRPTPRPGYGYRREDGRDIIIASEAATIREAARRVLDGESLRGIGADFNARAIPSPTGAPWQGVTLRQLIRRPSLAGLRTHRGVVVGKFDADLHPSILDEDTHVRLEALLTDPSRAQGTGGRTPVHLLSGLAVCGRCGDTLGGRMKRIPPWTPKPGQKSKPVKAAYACGTCHKVRRLQEPVDEFVTEVILRRLEQPDAAQLFSQGDEGAAQEAREAIAAIDARLATAADQFAEGVLTGDQLRRITERLRSDREAHERAVAASMPARVPVDVVGPLARQTWARLHIDSQRAIIDTVAQVVIEPQGSGRSFDPNLVRIVWKS